MHEFWCRLVASKLHCPGNVCWRFCCHQQSQYGWKTMAKALFASVQWATEQVMLEEVLL